MTTTKAVSRVSEAELAPIVEHVAKAANYSHEAFLELAMSLEHVRRLLPDDYDKIASVLACAFETWQIVEEASDDTLGSGIVLTGKGLPRIEA